MDRIHGSSEQRLRQAQRRFFVRTLAAALRDCWFSFLTFALMWVCLESLLFPTAPQWVGFALFVGGGVVATFGAIFWTIRTCPQLLSETARSKR